MVNIFKFAKTSTEKAIMNCIEEKKLAIFKLPDFAVTNTSKTIHVKNISKHQ